LCPTGNGFFINTAITMVSVHASLWAYLLLALDKSVDPEVQKYLSTVQVLQLGTLSVVVYLFTLTLEMGLLSSLFTIIRQVLQGQWVTSGGNTFCQIWSCFVVWWRCQPVCLLCFQWQQCASVVGQSIKVRAGVCRLANQVQLLLWKGCQQCVVAGAVRRQPLLSVQLGWGCCCCHCCCCHCTRLVNGLDGHVTVEPINQVAAVAAAVLGSSPTPAAGP
jgi:hypothetical protein